MKILKFKIIFSSHNKKFLKNKTLNFINWVFKNLVSSKFNLLNFKLITNLPVKKYKFSLLKSPHVNRKAQDQYEIETYRLAIQFDMKNEVFFIQNSKIYKILKFGILSIDSRISIILKQKGIFKDSL